MTALDRRFPSVNFTRRQRSLANRLLAGEAIHFCDLNQFDRSSALRLSAKQVVTFAPATNRLHLAPFPRAELHLFADGSLAKRVGADPRTISTVAKPSLTATESRAAEFAARQGLGQ